MGRKAPGRGHQPAALQGKLKPLHPFGHLAQHLPNQGLNAPFQIGIGPLLPARGLGGRGGRALFAQGGHKMALPLNFMGPEPEHAPRGTAHPVELKLHGFKLGMAL